MPNLIGKTAGQALSALAAAGLSSDPSDVYAPGKTPLRVFEQFPAPGTHVPSGNSVHYKIAKLAFAWRVVPNVVGKTKNVAVSMLSAAGFVANPIEQLAFGKPFGLVFDQNPNAGTLRLSGSTIDVRISKSLVAMKPVPNVVGMSSAAATIALSAAGFGTNAVAEIAPGKPAALVFDQDPNAGALAASGSVVKIRIAKGLAILKAVPNLFGKTASAAAAALSFAGFAGNPIEEFAFGKPVGKVYAQDPAGRRARDRGIGRHLSHRQGVRDGVPSRPEPRREDEGAGDRDSPGAGIRGRRGRRALPLLHAGARQESGRPRAEPSRRPARIVHLKISVGFVAPVFKLVPNVVGQTKVAAEAILSSAGFVPSVAIALKFGKPAHRVWDQTPNAGVLAPMGSVVSAKANP